MTLLLSIPDCWGYSTPPNFLLLQVTSKVHCACAPIFFIRSPTSRTHLDWLWSLVIVNNPTVLLISILPETNTAVRLQDRKMVQFGAFLFVGFCFESLSILFSVIAILIYILNNSVFFAKSSHFWTSLATVVYVYVVVCMGTLYAQTCGSQRSTIGWGWGCSLGTILLVGFFFFSKSLWPG